MRGNELLDLIEYIDADLIEEADHINKKERTTGWLKYFAALAACLAITAVSILQFQNHNREGLQMTGKSESVLSEDKVTETSKTATIYFVNGTVLCSEEKEIPLTMESVFESWKEANGIGSEVRLLSCEVINNSNILTFTVTGELEKYYKSKDPELLKKSLGKTMSAWMGIASEDYRLLLK